jgi:RNA polymerase sigma factor (sigma-70 family)
MPDAFDLNSTLAEFLHGSPAARETFPIIVAPMLRKMAANALRDRRRDLADEVVNEVYVDLLRQSASDFDPARGNAEPYLLYLVKHAARRVRASYTPVMSTTRAKKATHNEALPEDDARNAAEAIDGSASRIIAVCDANRILAKAAPRTRKALILVHYHGLSLRTAGKLLGCRDTTLARSINKFAAEYRTAA